MVKAELFHGAMKSVRPADTIAVQREFIDDFRSLPFNDAAANHYARIRASLERQGTPISSNDCMIAAIALANGLTLVTNNTAEFSRVVGLTLEDWQV